MDLGEATQRARKILEETGFKTNHAKSLIQEIAKELVIASADKRVTGILPEEELLAESIRNEISQAYALGLRVEIEEVDVEVYDRLDKNQRRIPEVRVWKEEEIR